MLAALLIACSLAPPCVGVLRAQGALLQPTAPAAPGCPPSGDIQELNARAANASASLDEKFLWPFLVSAAGLIIGLMAAIASIWVDSRRKEARILRQVRRDLKQSRKAFKRRFRVLEAQSTYSAGSAHYKLAYSFWKQKEYSDAIFSAQTALQDIDSALDAVADADGAALIASKDHAIWKKYRCHVIGDLAYYNADAFSVSHNWQRAQAALAAAHRLIREWEVFGEGLPMNLVDNLLYTFAILKTIPEEDLQRGRTLWRNYRGPLIEHLHRESSDLEQEHTLLFDRFFR